MVTVYCYLLLANKTKNPPTDNRCGLIGRKPRVPMPDRSKDDHAVEWVLKKDRFQCMNKIKDMLFVHFTLFPGGSDFLDSDCRLPLKLHTRRKYTRNENSH